LSLIRESVISEVRNKLVININVIRPLLLALLALTSTEVAATTSLQFSKLTFSAADIGTAMPVRISYATVSAGTGTTRQFTNIGGSVTFQLLSVSNTKAGSTFTNSFTFSAKVTNTSTAPMNSARISGIGFSTAAEGATGDNPAFLRIASATIPGTPSIYDVIAFTNNSSGLNLPNTAGSNNPQVCIKASGNLNNCSGGGGDGLQLANTNPFPSTSTTFVLNFTGPTARTAITLHNFVLRFQSLSGTGLFDGGSGTLNGASGVGIVTGVDVIPEPSSWAMLIAGFGLIGASLRRKRALATA
jgi:hypothetical protein